MFEFILSIIKYDWFSWKLTKKQTQFKATIRPNIGIHQNLHNVSMYTTTKQEKR